MSPQQHNEARRLSLDDVTPTPRLEEAPAERFRLLVVSSDTYPPTRVDVAVLFGDELARRGHKIDWILQSEADCARPYVASWGGGQVWVGASNSRTNLLGRLRKHAAGIWNDLKLFGLLKGNNYDAIEVKDKFISAVFALLAARWHHKRFIYWLSYPFPEEYLLRASNGTARYPLLYRIRGNVFSFLLYRMLLPAADHVFVQSDEMRRVVGSKGVPLAKLTAVPMGFKVRDPVANVPGRRVIPSQERCFLYLGALSRGRHIDFLLRVLAKMRNEMPEAKLYLVGKADFAEDEEFLLTEARRLGVLSSVVFVGQLKQSDALRYVQEADVCVSPLFPTPVFEVASPTKLVEYMAMGKAVVANTQPDQRLLIEESGGGYCVPYDEGEFATAIVKLLRAPDMARMMGERGKRYVMKHRAYGTIADNVERRMLDVVAGQNK